MRGWIEWFAQGLWRRRRPILITLAVSGTVVAFGLARSLDFGSRPPRTIHDATFEAAATSLCAKKIPPLRAVRREDQPEGNLEKETAAAIDKVATKLEGVVGELRALPVEPANRRKVAAWFGNYDDYIAAGRHYATAIRAGKPAVYNKVDDEAVGPLKAISHFAQANHLDACVP